MHNNNKLVLLNMYISLILSILTIFNLCLVRAKIKKRQQNINKANITQEVKLINNTSNTSNTNGLTQRRQSTTNGWIK